MNFRQDDLHIYDIKGKTRGAEGGICFPGAIMLLPITFSAMIPYILAMVVDIRTLSPVIKYIVYAIPFTHTFMASENVMFGNYSLYAGGLIYQIVLLVVCMTVALKIFMSDKIFTMSIGGKQRTRKSFAFKKR